MEIYDNLDRVASVGPLRPIQEDVLSTWDNDYLDKKDVIIKLHTGAGKTLIGLLALQSRLNMDKGPCIYVCPNIQLAQQVAGDADKFGVKYVLLSYSHSYLHRPLCHHHLHVGRLNKKIVKRFSECFLRQSPFRSFLHSLLAVQRHQHLCFLHC